MFIYIYMNDAYIDYLASTPSLSLCLCHPCIPLSVCPPVCPWTSCCIFKTVIWLTMNMDHIKVGYSRFGLSDGFCILHHTLTVGSSFNKWYFLVTELGCWEIYWKEPVSQVSIFTHTLLLVFQTACLLNWNCVCERITLYLLNWNHCKLKPAVNVQTIKVPLWRKYISL